MAAGVDAREPLPPGALGEAYEQLAPVPPVWAAIEFDCPTDLIDLLLAYGADPNAPGPDGRAPFPLAVRRGRQDLARALRRAGARDEVTDETELNLFLAFCLQADRPAAQRQLDRNRVRKDQLSEEDYATLVYAADHGHLQAVRLMLDLGFPPGARRDKDGATALHPAAGAGSAEVVRMLITRGADIDARDTAFEAAPLAWATVGGGQRFGRYPNPDFLATVQTLIDAGAATDAVWVSRKPPSPEVAELLRQHRITGLHPGGG